MGDQLVHDQFELTKCTVDLAEFAHEMEAVLRSVTHTGMTFAEQNTSITGDRFDTNTVILNDYGRIVLNIAMDPQSTNLALYTQQQIDGSNSGDKPTGSIAFYDSEGAETSSYDIERWHVEKFVIGPFNAKSSQNMEQSITIDMEKFTRT